MNKIIIIYISFCFSVLTFSQENKLTKNEITTLKEQIQSSATATKTVKSDFVQYKHLDFLSNDITTYGKLVFKAPNLVKWEYTKPYKYSVVFKNNSLLINDDGKKNNINIGSSNLFKRMNQLIIKSISGDMFDKNEFDISYSKSKTAYIVRFVTKDIKFKKFIKEFVLHFDLKKYDVKQVKMIEPSNDYTKIVFKNRIQNTQINDALFTN